ncbi:MAG TPA: CehA/McbA family metallohydrolase [Actinomycetota bacterium]|nr:CehA/McbA family metallohydrolase [Actinomycetota bacterium]
MGAGPTRRLLLALALSIAALPSVDAGAVPSSRGTAHRPAAPQGTWLAGDLHIHTCYSHDSWCPPNDDNTGPDEFYTLGLTVQEQFCAADQRGLDYLAITDHDDVRSVKDPGFGACGVTPVPGYEASYKGHAQVLGVREVIDAGDESAGRILAVSQRVRADGGVFQINHPAEGSTNFPADADWQYLYDVVPDTVEVWNISTLWQPPFPSGSSNDDALRYWEGWLNRGFRVGATGGSDNHWRSTHSLQGPGQPTTWVFARSPTEAGILEAIRQGRTFVSSQPPAVGGTRVFLEADADREGVYESMVGDTVPAGAPLRVRVEGAPGALLRVVADGTEPFPPVSVSSTSFEHRFTLSADARWVRAEVLQRDLQGERAATCDPVAGGETTYCRNRLAVLALTSAIYLQRALP